MHQTIQETAHVARDMPVILALCLGVLLASCGPSSTPPHATGVPDFVAAWIRQHASPLKTVEPSASDADLQPLTPIVGSATIVGLGEATHGTHEFFALKSRIVKFLVQQMGFNTFALENGWAASLPMEQYVATGEGNPSELLQHDYYAAWQTQEFLALYEAIRAYNADPSHATKVQVVGIDSWNVTQSAFDQVASYLHSVDPQQGAHAQALYAGFRPTIPAPVFVDYDGFSRLPQATKQQYESDAQHVYDLLQSSEALYESRSSKQAFEMALQSAHVILQYTALGVLIPPLARSSQLTPPTPSATNSWPTMSRGSMTRGSRMPRSCCGHTTSTSAGCTYQ